MTVSNTFCACFVKCDQELHPAHVAADVFFKPVMPNQWQARRRKWAAHRHFSCYAGRTVLRDLPWVRISRATSEILWFVSTPRAEIFVKLMY